MTADTRLGGGREQLSHWTVHTTTTATTKVQPHVVVKSDSQMPYVY